MTLLSGSLAEPGGDDATLGPDSGHSPFDPSTRERTIPLRVGDLNRLLLADPGLDAAERAGWDRLAQRIALYFHDDFYDELLELKERYAPLDPDSDCVPLPGHTRKRSEESDEDFLSLFEAMLIRANYRVLDVETLKRAVAAPNEMGLNYVPDFELFEHLTVYVRGETKIRRSARTWKTRFRKEVVFLDGYQRLVVALKFRPGKHLGDYARADVLYLRMFKDVPYVDMEMHLPEQGTKVRMRVVDKAQIASPFAISLPSMVMKAAAVGLGGILNAPLVMAALVGAPISAGVNAFAGFQRAKQRHLHRMIRHLYYLTLANNASVITRIVDSAEEEEVKEALLAYFALWRGDDDPHPWDQPRLDAHVEALLRERAGISVDFEIGDALHKLHRLGLVTCNPNGQLRVVPLVQAIERLDRPVEPVTTPMLNKSSRIRETGDCHKPRRR
jgi:hypothetical protein